MNQSPPTPRVSVLMPTWHGMEFLGRVFDALAAQETGFDWDMHVIDSASTDGTWEFLRERQAKFPVPLRIERIHGVEFDHGDTRNLLAAKSRGALMVFLTQDAIPSSKDWLTGLVRNFDDEKVGAAYCRNVPRPDARPLTKLFSAGDPGYTDGRRETTLPPADEYAAMNAHEKRLLYNFNDVASAVRRDLWELHPFPRTPFGEDILMARALLEGGWTVVYDDVATVEHSHDYDADETRKRARIDGEFNAEWLNRICIESAKDARILTERLSEGDAADIRALGLDDAATAGLLTEARALRAAAFEGLFEGGRTTRRRVGSSMRDRRDLRLLYVVHGFPPDTWAGTEIYTLNIAKEMQRRGHAVTVLCRAPAVGDEPEFSLREGEFEGLRVLRMTHRLDHANLRESFRKEAAENAFRRVLADVEPDLVHFQHLIHLSIGLVEIAKAAGCATVVTCHDYWALCSRVQMIRPDGSICSSNMGSGCFLCVKEKGLDQVERASKLDGKLGAGRVLNALAESVKDFALTPAKASRRASEYADVRARETEVPAAYAAADLRISPSRFLRDIYLASGAFEPHTFLFSDNGMRTDHVEALQKEPDAEGRIRFGFVGTLVWYKGGEVLVRAFRRMQEAGLGDRVHLHVYGGFTPETDEHHKLLEELAEGAPVTFHGRFDNGRLSEVYRDIDVLVVPSVWYENSPITIHEAYLTETPVLASNIGGMAEFVRDGVDGMLFEVGDEADLAGKMTQLVEDPELLPRLSRAEWMEIKTIASNGDETEARYRGLCTIDRPVTAGPGGPILDLPATDTKERVGEVENQGAEDLLIRPGGHATWDLGALWLGPIPAGAYRLEIDLVFLESEVDVPLAGVILFGSTERDRIPLRTSADHVGTLTETVTVSLAEGEASLTLRPEGPAGAAAFLRLRRIRLAPAASPTSVAAGDSLASRP